MGFGAGGLQKPTGFRVGFQNEPVRFPWSSASTKTDSRPMDAGGTSYQFGSVARPLQHRCTTVA